MTLPPLLRSPRRLLPGAALLAALIVLSVVAPSTPGDDGPGAVIAGPGQADGGAQPAGAGGVGVGGEGGDHGTGPGDEHAAGGRTPGTASGGRSAAGASGGTGVAAGSGSATSGQGVTDTEIVVTFAYQPESCGQDISAFTGMVNPNPDPARSVQTVADYFNKRAAQIFGANLPPELRDQMGTGFYGRKLKPVLVTDHGQACAEQSRADAQNAAERYKPFGSVGGSHEWDDVMAKRGIVRITDKPALDDYFTSRRPFLWGPITGASDINFYLAGYTASFLNGKKTGNTGSLETSNKDRVFGIIHLDDAETRKIVGDLRSRLGQRGVSVARVVGYEPNVGTIGSQATNTILQMKGAGVTTILMVMDPIAALFMTQAADNQNYFPEWITNTYGLMDGNAGPRLFMTRTQVENAFGISVFFPSKQIRQEEQEAYRAWKAEHPDEEPPSDFAGWYSQAKALLRGIALAGPNLTPQTFESGLNRWCNPCVRDDPFLPLVGYGPGDFTAIDDAHRQRYDPNAPDYSAPRSEWQNGEPPRGAYVYEEGGRRYSSFE